MLKAGRQQTNRKISHHAIKTQRLHLGKWFFYYSSGIGRPKRSARQAGRREFKLLAAHKLITGIIRQTWLTCTKQNEATLFLTRKGSQL